MLNLNCQYWPKQQCNNISIVKAIKRKRDSINTNNNNPNKKQQLSLSLLMYVVKRIFMSFSLMHLTKLIIIVLIIALTASIQIALVKATTITSTSSTTTYNLFDETMLDLMMHKKPLNTNNDNTIISISNTNNNNNIHSTLSPYANNDDNYLMYKNNNNKRDKNQQEQLSPTRVTGATLEKEVVELLIRRYAPVVWLAPEEKFMPMGVDEFLNHVHPMDKEKKLDNSPIKSNLPNLNDNSEKTYLVTNQEIDELLMNETSFIYGRNPNENPVPIYAVVTLCNINNKPPYMENKNNEQFVTTAAETLPDGVMQHQHEYQTTKQMQEIITINSNNNNSYTKDNPNSPMRSVYIPLSSDIHDQQLHKAKSVLRSSRFYSLYRQRYKRELLLYEDINNLHLTSDNYDDDVEKEEKLASRKYELMTGETDAIKSNDEANQMTSSQTTTNVYGGAQEVNNFIANLADNVKFTPPMVAEGHNNNNTNNYRDESLDLSTSKVNNQHELTDSAPAFHVTYWMFYPYSQGKSLCTVSLGPLGRIPFPAVYGFCLGRRKEIGSHIGDWEHMSLYFNGKTEPVAMYVSAHDAGAFYTYNRLTGSFEFKKQETRKGILQRPNFPKTVTTLNNHPVLFAAKGSHGLWTAPGKHRFVKVARLYDINGFGTAWNTWQSVEIAYESQQSQGRSLLPAWLAFKGRWGNPKSKCHPFRSIGLNFCEFTDGPTGIPMKEQHFQCDAGFPANY